MVDKSTNRRTELVRIEGAKVAGVYHPLIHEKVMKVMRRYMHVITYMSSFCYVLFAICTTSCELKIAEFGNRHDRRVFAWTVDDSSSMKKMLFEHVDAIVTSNPSLLQQLMHETRTECMEDGFALP
jgi:hypothetical protein